MIRFMEKTYELIQKPGFLKDAFALEKPVQKKVVHAVEVLERDPFGPKTKRIFNARYKNLYRYRIGDHRIIYAVGTGCISILAVGPRGRIYERFQPSAEAVALAPGDLASAAPRPVPTAPDDQVPDALPPGDDAADAGPDADAAGPDTAGEASADHDHSHGALLRGLLDAWGVADTYHDRVLACGTADELLDLDLPGDVVERILHLKAPPRLDELVAQPDYELRRARDLADFFDGTLSGFLLRLDPEQARVADRNAAGPMLVKGGPGTGKSLVALYRIAP
jgi:mRNA-degrading endonuclease RelE of RelBE toxin-antitoxin system